MFPHYFNSNVIQAALPFFMIFAESLVNRISFLVLESNWCFWGFALISNQKTFF